MCPTSLTELLCLLGFSETEGLAQSRLYRPHHDELCKVHEICCVTLHKHVDRANSGTLRGGFVDRLNRGGEHAALLYHRIGARQGFSAHQIDHSIHSFRLVLETLAFVVDHLINPQGLQVLDVSADCSTDHPYFQIRSDLRSVGAHAAGGALDENRHTWFRMNDIANDLQGRRSRSRQGRSRSEVHRVGDRSNG